MQQYAASEHPHLTLLTGNSRRHPKELKAAATPNIIRRQTAISLDVAALSEMFGARHALEVGMTALIPRVKQNWTRFPAPDVTDNPGGMRLAVWAVLDAVSRESSEQSNVYVVDEPVDAASGERLITNPSGTVQRKHALAGSVGAARIVMLPDTTLTRVEFSPTTDKARIAPSNTMPRARTTTPKKKKAKQSRPRGTRRASTKS